MTSDKIKIENIHDLEDKTISQIIKYIKERLLNPDRKIFNVKTKELISVEELSKNILKWDYDSRYYTGLLITYVQNLPGEFDKAGEEIKDIFHRLIKMIEKEKIDHQHQIQTNERLIRTEIGTNLILKEELLKVKDEELKFYKERLKDLNELREEIRNLNKTQNKKGGL